MNEANITYVDLKHLPSKKQMQREKIKEPPIYSEVKNTTSNSNQTKITRNKSSKRNVSSVPFTRCLTVVILGIFCFSLLVTTGILGFMVFQGHHKCQPQKLPLDNVTQEDNSTLENTPIVKEPQHTGSKNSTCERKWSCCGEKCYYFSHELKSFEESKKSCKAMNSTLLKIDDEKELVEELSCPHHLKDRKQKEHRKFIQSQLSAPHWIGLSRRGASSSWRWEDGSQFLIEIDWHQTKIGNCARITARNIAPSECSKSSNYICEKKIAALAVK